MKITFLGTGTSHGVPLIGCNCDICLSDDPKNKRNRSSVYIQFDDLNLLIDTPPELRLGLLKNNISQVDAVLYTHPHADHLMGFDDIRALNMINNKTMPCYGNNYTIKEIKTVFPYINHNIQQGGGIPDVRLITINSNFLIKDKEVYPLPVKHGKLDIYGYRIENMAYITDCSFIPEATFKQLKGIDLIILGALRYRPHSTHMNIEQAIKTIKKLNVSRAYLTHLSHEIEHNKVSRELPENIFLAYDGLIVEVE
ncbi:MBL fold metallo-hydrolase [Halocella sp. SP3-1]|uniref:MBL fold metallo-hydrolase n=1 Tax=Halocella sp. SP3-1 TaxID=2382161 RepID=UPI000F751594|nr:MBL fold metallo-hydrolase [Halocella sp. SP3-1]AZO95393.1 MBL fold metallo-hydrolase [Halocella sp. SP3-1]